MNDNPYSKYKLASATTENHGQKLVFIFDEVIKTLHQVKKCMEDKDIEGKYKKLVKLEDVFHTLSMGLDTTMLDENSKATLKSLENFYILTAAKLSDININNKIEEIDVIVAGISNLRSTLTEILRQ
jgi:flagellar biosynthetic protein FliS